MNNPEGRTRLMIRKKKSHNHNYLKRIGLGLIQEKQQ